MTFENRAEAGKILAGELKKHEHGSDAVVYGLPRGGVETAAEVALALDAPLELIVARKIGHPFDPEYAVGAVTESGPATWNEAELASLDDTWAKQAEAAARTEAKRRRERYMPKHKPVSVTNKTAMLIDDGIATGLTMLAAIEVVRTKKPRRIIVAVPCAPNDVISDLMEHTDEVLVLTDPDEYLGSVGAYYEDFPQLTDEDVIDILARFEA